MLRLFTWHFQRGLCKIMNRAYGVVKLKKAKMSPFPCYPRYIYSVHFYLLQVTYSPSIASNRKVREFAINLFGGVGAPDSIPAYFAGQVLTGEVYLDNHWKLKVKSMSKQDLLRCVWNAIVW